MTMTRMIAAVFGTALVTLSPAIAQDAPQVDQSGPLGEILGVQTGPEVFSEIEIDGLSADRLAGTPVFSADGDEVGSVTDLLIETGPDKIVVDLSGFFELTPRDTTLSLGDVRIEEGEDSDLRVITGLRTTTLEDLADDDAV